MLKVSVILPVFNVQSYVKNTLLSVLNQTFKNIEVIIVNDCSSDASLEVIKSINDSRIRIINNKKNYGLAKSRNIGLKKVTGDLVYFMDSDDEIRPNLFDELVKFFNKDPNLNMVCFNYEKRSNQTDSNDLNKISLTWNKEVSSLNALKELMNDRISITAWSYIVKKEFLQKINFSFTQGRLFEDMNTTTLLLSKVGKINLAHFTPAPYLYLQRDGSIMGKNKRIPTNKEINDIFFMIMSQYKIFRANLNDNILVDHWLLNLLYYYYEFYFCRIHDKNPLKRYLYEIIIVAGKNELGLKEKIKFMMVKYPTLFLLKNFLTRFVKLS